MERVFDDDGIEYDVSWNEKVQTSVSIKIHVDEKTFQEQEKRREERIRKEQRA